MNDENLLDWLNRSINQAIQVYEIYILHQINAFKNITNVTLDIIYMICYVDFAQGFLKRPKKTSVTHRNGKLERDREVSGHFRQLSKAVWRSMQRFCHKKSG